MKFYDLVKLAVGEGTEIWSTEHWLSHIDKENDVPLIPARTWFSSTIQSCLGRMWEEYDKDHEDWKQIEKVRTVLEDIGRLEQNLHMSNREVGKNAATDQEVNISNPSISFDISAYHHF